MRCILFSEKSSCYELLFQKKLNSESTLPSFAVTIGPYQITGGKNLSVSCGSLKSIDTKGPSAPAPLFSCAG